MPSIASRPHAAPSRWPDQLAAVDIGSNSFRLEIAQFKEGRYRRIDYLKETVRLGAGLDSHGVLSAEATDRGLACLRRFAQRLEGFTTAQVRAVATQTLREASNRNEFLARAEPVLGHPIEVISGREEARLIYAGVAMLQASDQPRMVIDIGGRSTEIILGVARKPLRAESFQVGSVSLSMAYFADGRLTEQAFRAAQVAAGAEFEEALEPFGRQHWREALGSSGSVGAVSQLLAANGQGDGTITPDGLRWLIAQCVRAGRVDKLDLAGLKDDRRAVIAGGLSILYTLSTHFGIDALHPARGALRQGVIFDLAERLDAAAGATHGGPSQDIRNASVAEMQRRFQVDVPHAQRVAAVAGTLFDSVAGNLAGAEARRDLLWMAALHEIGMMVSHHDHHRHSAYLLAHVDAAGFSQSQQRRLSELLLAQRGGLRKVEASLADPVFAWQVMCLRLAIIECHARAGVDKEALSLQRDGRRARLHVEPGWPETHPRTQFLLQQEALAWSKVDSLALVLPPWATDRESGER